MKVSATDVCRALRDDRSPRSGWLCDRWGNVDQPRRELWLAEAQMWVRISGHRVTGWRGLEYFAEWFGPISAFRIRRAVRSWAARSSKAQPIRAEGTDAALPPGTNPNSSAKSRLGGEG